MPATLVGLTALLTLPGYLPSGHRWAPDSMPVPYCITPNATRTRLSPEALRQAVVGAIDQWRTSASGGAMSCSTFDATLAAGPCSTLHAADGVNNIYWQSNWMLGSQVIGVTYSTFSGQCGSITDAQGMRWDLGCTVDADTEFNDRDYTWTDDGVSGTDVGSIALHEYGHFIGLDHCNNNGTCRLGTGVMYASYAGGALRVPLEDDVAGACLLYPGTKGGVGYPCSDARACTGGVCVGDGTGSYCSQACGACPPGYSCGASAQAAGQMVCLRDTGLQQGLCQVCNGAPGACAARGVCVSGLPEATGGRCAVPCPDPAAPDGRCPAGYGCYPESGSAGVFCMPKSGDCTNLDGALPLARGQVCSADSPPCAAGLTCIGICADTCSGVGRGTCPDGYGCAPVELENASPMSFCLPAALEGQTCTGLKACAPGPCLEVEPGADICYRDCSRAGAGGCNNAQTCNAYAFGDGTQVAVCEPPGVPPTLDAGMPAPPLEPCGQGCREPCGQGCREPCGQGCREPCGQGCREPCGQGCCTCDTGAGCQRGCACDPGCKGSDGGLPGNPARPTDRTGACTCDQTASCSPGCPCDADCPTRPAPAARGCRCVLGAGAPGRGWGAEAPICGIVTFLLGCLGVRRLLR